MYGIILLLCTVSLSREFEVEGGAYVVAMGIFCISLTKVLDWLSLKVLVLEE